MRPGHAVGEVCSQIMSNCLGQTRLADATRAGQRQQRDRLIEQKGARRRPFGLPPDEPGTRERKGAEA